MCPRSQSSSVAKRSQLRRLRRRASLSGETDGTARECPVRYFRQSQLLPHHVTKLVTFVIAAICPVFFNPAGLHLDLGAVLVQISTLYGLGGLRSDEGKGEVIGEWRSPGEGRLLG